MRGIFGSPSRPSHFPLFSHSVTMSITLETANRISGREDRPILIYVHTAFSKKSSHVGHAEKFHTFCAIILRAAASMGVANILLPQMTTGKCYHSSLHIDPPREEGSCSIYTRRSHPDSRAGMSGRRHLIAVCMEEIDGVCTRGRENTR